jgi:hypothetical protein
MVQKRRSHFSKISEREKGAADILLLRGADQCGSLKQQL